MPRRAGRRPRAAGRALTHLDARGRARMVDVSEKEITEREAVASGRVRMKASTLARITAGKMAKGDVFAAARIAGILGAKTTPSLIPLCHPLCITGVSIDFTTHRRPPGVSITCHVKTRDRTGVEMEALTGVATAALTLYDMCKSVDREMEIGDIRLERKAGGRSGLFVRGPRR
jgi:cyclic pyranopterin phosphate synthase